MKIDRVTLENFGIYTRKVLQLDSAPLVLIYGPNESGKTTALNGLRQALFGFKLRTPYLTSRQMSAEVVGRMANGTTLEFSRRKARQDELEGSHDGRAVQSEDIQKLLCNLDLASYEHLFGFSLDELREGEAALKSARLSEALAGGGLGGMGALQKLRSELGDSLAELYKSRGSTSRINLKLSEIRKCADSLRATQVLPAEVEDLQRELIDLREQSDEVRRQVAAAIHAQRSAERVRDALPKFRRRSALLRQLGAMELPENIDMAFVAHWGEYADQRKELVAKCEDERSMLETEQFQLNQLDGSQELTESEAEIELVGHQASEIASMRHRLSELNAEAADAALICQRLLQSLELEQFDDRLHAFTISVPKRKELESLAKDYALTIDEKIATAARLEVAKESLSSTQHTAEFAHALPENLSELASSVARLAEFERALSTKSQTLKEAVEDADFQALEKQLRGVFDGSLRDLDSTWTLPSAKQVQQHQYAMDDLRREISQANRQASKVEKDLSIAGTQLEEMDRLQAETILKKSGMISAARDTILGQWLDDLSQPLIAASITAEDQRERLLELQRLATAADKVQSELLAAADTLALFNQKTQVRNSLKSELVQSRKRIEELSSRESVLLAEWAELWSSLPFVPPLPDAALGWLADFARWCELAIEQEHTRRELHIARGIVRNQRAQLQDLWPTNLRDEVASDALLSQVRTWENSVRDLDRDQQRIAAANQSVRVLTQRLEELTKKQSEIQKSYGAWLNQMPVSADWPIEQVGSLIDSLEQLRREHTAQQKAQAQSESITKQLEQYAQKVGALAATIGDESSTGLPEQHASRWLADLQAMRQQRTARIQLNTSIQHRTKRVGELEARQSVLDSKLAALCSDIGTGDPSGVGSLVERVRQAEVLRSEVAELTASIESFGGDEAIADFVSRLDAANEVELEVEIQELQRTLQRLDESRKDMDQRIGALTQRIEQLANNAAALRNQQQLQDQRGELAELSEQWVVQRLAQELLSRSIERFAADHEPALLHYTRDYLKRLTNGRYTSVEHDNAGKSSFVVRNARDESFTPDQLSTGAREQLYLAIRMAFITHHCEYHEPLPVIMDDCFVNFDDSRTGLALEAISEWDQSIQTILLSCHWRVVQTLAEFAPSTLVIHLEKDLQTTAGELVAARQVLS